MVDFFCGNILRVKAVDRFRKGAPWLMFDGILNVTLSEEKVFTTGVTQGNLELFLSSKSPRPHFLEGKLIHLVEKAKYV